MPTEFNPGGAPTLDAAIKARYEANPDTNAFTDAAEAKLAGIAAGATANATDAQLRDRAAHTGAHHAHPGCRVGVRVRGARLHPRLPARVRTRGPAPPAP